MALIRPGGPTPPTQNGGATPPPGAQPPPHYGDPGGPAYHLPSGWHPPTIGNLGHAPGTFDFNYLNPGGGGPGKTLTGGQNPAVLHLINGTMAGGPPRPTTGPPAWWPSGSPWPPGPVPNPPTQDGPIPGSGGPVDPYGPPVRPPVSNILAWLLSHWQNGGVPPTVV